MSLCDSSYDVALLPTNKRGLSQYENVCVHEDGFEAKVSVPDDLCHWGKGTLHLYVAQKNQFRYPELVAAYVAHVFNSGDIKKNTDLFFDGQFKVRIPDHWIVDGVAVKEEGCFIECSRSDQHKSRYKTRGVPNDVVSSVPMLTVVDTEAKLKMMIKQRVISRLYKKDFEMVHSIIFNAITRSMKLGMPRSDYERAITTLIESDQLKKYIDKPSRDKITQNYRASDHVRNRTTNLARMIRDGGYGGIRG